MFTICIRLTFLRGEAIPIPIMIDLHDCGKFWGDYVYFVRGGKKLDKGDPERVYNCVYTDPDEFIAEAEKHRLASMGIV